MTLSLTDGNLEAKIFRMSHNLHLETKGKKKPSCYIRFQRYRKGLIQGEHVFAESVDCSSIWGYKKKTTDLCYKHTFHID